MEQQKEKEVIEKLIKKLTDEQLKELILYLEEIVDAE